MIRAYERFRMAVRFEAELRATMSAAIHKDMDLAFVIANHHNRFLPNIGLEKITRSRDFGCQTDIVPGAPTKNTLLLARVD